LDADTTIVIHLSHRDFDEALDCVFDSVRKQIDDDLPQPVLVSIDDCGGALFYFQFHVNSLHFCLEMEDADALL